MANRLPLVTTGGVTRQMPLGDVVDPTALPAMAASGASHAKGAVPDPGATAYTNYPRVLLDSAAWGYVSGQVLGSLWVPTQQTTTSTTLVDLATADSVTFTLDATADVLVLYFSEGFNTSATALITNTILLDGVSQVSNSQNMPNASAPLTFTTVAKLTGLAAGSHTIKVQHSTNTGTGGWLNRLLMIVRG